MREYVGDDGDAEAFREALFYNIPERFMILYEQDVDLYGHFDNLSLGFGNGQSLVDSRFSHLAVKCRDDYDEKVIEIYNFRADAMDHILKGDCKVAHNIPLVDDGFGVCTKAWALEGVRPENGFLRVIRGVTRGAIIGSMFGTRTSIHVEDSMLATFNLLVLGAPKVWYIVPSTNDKRFQRFLLRKGLLEAAFQKRCFIEAFADDPLAIAEAEMELYGVRRVVQRLGMTVMTVFGIVFH